MNERAPAAEGQPELYAEELPGRGPRMLLVHGVLSSRAQWGPNLEALGRVCRPVVVELWGHGRSPSPEDPEAYRPTGYVAAFERLRERLSEERWLVCGQSFGAALTLRYALEHPERVIAQIFTNSSSALADEAWVEQVKRGLEERSRALEQAGREGLERIPVHPRNAKRLPAAAKAEILADAELLDPAGVARNLRYTTPDSSVRQRVGENRVPTLLVCGEREERFAESRQYAERAMPQLEVVGLDAGHAVNLEAAEAWNEAVIAFVERQVAGPRP